MKKYFLFFVVTFLCTSLVCVNVAFSKSERFSCRFSDVYPVPFYKTKTALIGGIALSAVGTVVITYFTAGTGTAAAAGPIATYIGTALGSLSGLSGIAATNAGLALLGGGSVASGGFGILGGVALLSGVGDLALGATLMQLENFIPSDKTERALTIAIPIPDRIGSKAVRSKVRAINELKDKNDDVSRTSLAIQLNDIIENKYGILSSKDDEEQYFNHIIWAICCYNMGEYEQSERIISDLEKYSDLNNKNFLYYLKGLLAVTNGDNHYAKILFDTASRGEKDITPYLASVQIAIRENNKSDAISKLELIRNNIDDDNYTVNNTLAGLYLERKYYDKALDMYKDALSDVTINEYEAECKTFIAICYYKMGKITDAHKWLDDAMDEIEDQKELQEQYRQFFLEYIK